jgi:hypothetical protein
MTHYTQTFTLTYGDIAENNPGMQRIGKLATGFTLDDLHRFRQHFKDMGRNTMLVNLSKQLPDGEISDMDAYLLVIRDGLSSLLNTGTNDDFYMEQSNLTPDKKALMRGSVKNKRARWNLCFNHIGQDPDYENGKGTIIPYDQVPLLNEVRLQLEQLTNRTLVVEGNYYYDPSKCHIGFHGDTERRCVIGVRSGQSMNLYFHWYKRHEPIGRGVKVLLNSGDIYIMSTKAVGYDWKKSTISTLRHAAGCSKYTTIQ